MKKFKYYAGLLLIAVAVSVTSCGEDYDDTAIKNDIADLQSRVEKLETWCTTVNGQISALQGLVSALEAKDYVTGVSPTTTNDGYTITFSKSEAITIHNGKDGAKGADGITPIIGVAKDTDGEYYWTVKTGTAAATWMLDANNKKIRTTGDKGADGSAGVNGQSPVLSVATDTDGKVYWKVNGEWMLNGGKKVQATGDKGDKGETGSVGAAGAAGAKGDAVFAADGVTVDKTKGTVTFTLAGEDGATFTLPMASEMKIFDKFDEFKVNSEKHELTLALNVKEGDYAAIKAELTSSKGMTTVVVKATTRAASTLWGVELTSPTFKEDKTIDVNAKVIFTLPAGIEEGEFALLKVSIVGKDGTEHSATRVIVYTTEVSVESVTLTDQSVTKGGTVKLEPIFTPATATNKNVTWKSSNPEVAAIAADGTVTGVSIGETTITVTTEDGEFTATCKVKVTTGPGFENEGETGIDGSSWDKAYTIKNKEQLVLLATRVNGDQSDSWNSKYYKLLNNIDLGTMEWTPIGDTEKSFSGNFDGAGYSISGTLKMEATKIFVGIFGSAMGATIQNLSFKGNINECEAPSLGSIIGYAIETQIVNCHNTAALINAGQSVGGIAGRNVRGTIIACSNSGAVTNINKYNAGGIVGNGPNIIIGCFNTASIVGNWQVGGGIVGTCKEITACWSAANTITSTDDQANKGGIVASPEKAKYCYWKAIDGISSAIGDAAAGNAENCETFSGDTPSADQIKAMNDAWQAADANREYQFNATTGMIEKKP